MDRVVWNRDFSLIGSFLRLGEGEDERPGDPMEGEHRAGESDEENNWGEVEAEDAVEVKVAAAR